MDTDQFAARVTALTKRIIRTVYLAEAPPGREEEAEKIPERVLSLLRTVAEETSAMVSEMEDADLR